MSEYWTLNLDSYGYEVSETFTCPAAGCDNQIKINYKSPAQQSNPLKIYRVQGATLLDERYSENPLIYFLECQLCRAKLTLIDKTTVS